MAEWLYEAGIGENRAALVEDDAILEAIIELDDGGPRAGAVVLARLGASMPPTGARVRFEDGREALLDRIPPGIGEGGTLRVELVREAIAEPGHAKLARVRVAAPDAALAAGPTLRERIAATAVAVRTLGHHEPDALEAAGWSELVDEAERGIIAFPGGRLRLAITPAMALFDVDGTLAPAALAIAGAAAAARAIRRMGLGGSIGIDLPTLTSRSERQAAAAAFDAALPQPFERTAVNGFGFLQVVRRRTRPSLPEQIAADPIGHAARALLRRAARGPGAGARTLTAHPRVIARIAERADWSAALERALGAAVRLRADGGLAISSGDVSTQYP